METLKKQFIVEINVLNVNRREGRVFGGLLRVFEGGFEGGFGILSHLFQQCLFSDTIKYWEKKLFRAYIHSK
jgi:hypothetical protein